MSSITSSENRSFIYNESVMRTSQTITTYDGLGWLNLHIDVVGPIIVDSIPFKVLKHFV